MKSSDDSAKAPRLAEYLLELLTPYEQTEAILGDLREEFSAYGAQHGAALARRWYRRQCRKTVWHMVLGGLRSSPWQVSWALTVGVVLFRLSVGLPEQVEFAILNWNHEFHANWVAYVSWMGGLEILTARLFLCLFVGTVVGLLAKGREVTTAAGLALVLMTIAAVQLYYARVVSPYRYALAVLALEYCVDVPWMILLGAWAVRDLRAARFHRAIFGRRR